MGVQIADAAEECRIENGPLAVKGRWSGDQWLLTIEQRLSSGWSLVATSIEVAPSASDLEIEGPVFQQKIARTNGESCGELLLIGQFGRRHFSGVVTVSAGKIVIEIADRWIVPLPLSKFRWTWRSTANIAIAPKDPNFTPGKVAFDHKAATIAYSRGDKVCHPLSATLENDELTLRGELGAAPLEPGTMQYACQFWTEG